MADRRERTVGAAGVVRWPVCPRASGRENGPEETSMIGIYERVSSTGQDLASQHHELEKWALGKNDVKWFKDTFTGRTTDRPGLNKLLGQVRQGKVKHVVVWRLDRLGRTALGLHQLFEEFQALKVNFVSIRDGINLETPTGRMVAGILSSVAVYETEVRGERIKAGMEAKKQRVAEGKETWNVGRPAGTQHKITPEVKEQLFLMKDGGKKVSVISRVLRISRQSVYTALKQRD
jgi:DNA invertase Pin-like site-specific DNA recombinase